MDLDRTKWWGWGASDKRYDLSERPFFWPHLKRRLDVPERPFFFPPSMDEVELPAGRFSPDDLKGLRRALPAERVRVSKADRLTHTYGKSYHDLIRIRKKVFPEVPDAVVYPRDEQEVRGLLSWAVANRVALIPWGGGTSVTGGVEAALGPNHRALMVIDLRGMDRVLAIHKVSLLADVEAGILGPKLEDTLQAEGLTLSHYPESFELSTLGGWIAARAAGQQSTLYGKIDDMVESVRVVTPLGVVQTPHVPAAANGPDLTRLIIGSEGIFGIITQARIRLRPLPEAKFYGALLFRSFDEGAEAMRRILQSGLKPATLRLSDGEETDFIFSLRRRKPSALARTAERLGLGWVERRGFRPGRRSILIWGLEGRTQDVRSARKAIRGILRSFRVFDLGEGTGEQWYRSRFENPYLRDLLMDYDILVDTLETATEWDHIGNLYGKARDAIEQAYERLHIRGVVTAHLSHMYPTGSSIYFILLATPHVGQESDEWWVIKKAASDAIVAGGGTISHHHGIGLDHRPWLERELGQEGLSLLRNLKRSFDPEGVLNPKKLLPDS